jgi:hypothetical protein
MDLNLNFDLFGNKISDNHDKAESAPVQKRGSVRYYETRDKYLYKRAHSELQLLNCLNDQPLTPGSSYHFITQGDVDMMSYLRLVLRTYKKLDYLLFSTWCMAGEDILYLFDLHKQGVITRMDAYLGEIFKSSYPHEYTTIKDMYATYPIGRIAFFKNHSKIFAGMSSCGQGFGVQSSANINTNPRTENGCITIDTSIFHFYKDYFDGIKSIYE